MNHMCVTFGIREYTCHIIHELKRKLPKNAFLVAMSHNVSEKSYTTSPEKVPKYACINIQLRINPSFGACNLT